LATIPLVKRKSRSLLISFPLANQVIYLSYLTIIVSEKGHVSKNCNARKYDVSKGYLKWISKGPRKDYPCWTQPIKGTM